MGNSLKVNLPKPKLVTNQHRFETIIQASLDIISDISLSLSIFQMLKKTPEALVTLIVLL